MWNWWPFSKAAVKQPAELIWLSPEARHTGVVRDLERHLHSASRHFVLAQFGQSLDDVENALAQAGVAFHPLVGDTSVAQLFELFTTSESPLMVTGNVEWLPEITPEDAVEFERLDIAGSTRMTVVERHFLRAFDDRVIQNATAWPGRTTVQFHVSLTDPLLLHFAGPRTMQTLQGMGMHNNEALRMTSLSRRIRHAQRFFQRGIREHLEQPALAIPKQSTVAASSRDSQRTADQLQEQTSALQRPLPHEFQQANSAEAWLAVYRQFTGDEFASPR